MKAKFTAGPWKSHPASSVVGSLVSYGDISKGENICAVMPQRDKSVCEANAALISAAPELYEALQACLKRLYAIPTFSEDRAAIALAESALKKAVPE